MCNFYHITTYHISTLYRYVLYIIIITRLLRPYFITTEFYFIFTYINSFGNSSMYDVTVVYCAGFMQGFLWPIVRYYYWSCVHYVWIHNSWCSFVSQMLMTDWQREILCNHQQMLSSKRAAIVQERVEELILPRDRLVTPLLKVKVAGVHNNDIDNKACKSWLCVLLLLIIYRLQSTSILCRYT